MFKLIKISPEHHDMLKEYSQKKHRTMKGTLEK